MKWQVDKMTSWWNDKLMKWQVDEMTSWWNDKLMTWQVDDMTSWWNDTLMKWQVVELISWWNNHLMNWQVDKTAIWWNDKLMKRLYNEMTSWWNDKLIKWLYDERSCLSFSKNTWQLWKFTGNWCFDEFAQPYYMFEKFLRFCDLPVKTFSCDTGRKMSFNIFNPAACKVAPRHSAWRHSA